MAKEHEKAFEMAQNEAKDHFHRCHGCHLWVCDSDFNEDEGLCVECAPRQDIYVAKAKAEAMRRNIDDYAQVKPLYGRVSLKVKQQYAPSAVSLQESVNFVTIAVLPLLAANAHPAGVKMPRELNSVMNAVPR